MAKSDYLYGWNEASSFVQRFDMAKKQIWIKNPKVEGGGYWQEREVSNAKPLSNKRTRAKQTPSVSISPATQSPQLKSKIVISPDQPVVEDNPTPVIQSKYIDVFSPVSPYSPHKSPKVEQAITDFEEKVRFNNFETLGIIDPKTGNQVFEKKGDLRSIVTTVGETKKFTDCIRIHNHPGLGYSNIETDLTKEKIDEGRIAIGLLGQGFSSADIIEGIRTGGTLRVTALAYDYQLDIPEVAMIPSSLGKNFKLRRYDLKDERMNALFRQEMESFVKQKAEEIKVQLKKNDRNVPLGSVYARRKGNPSGLVIVCDSPHETSYNVFKELKWNYKKMRNSTTDEQVKEQLLSQFSSTKDNKINKDSFELPLDSDDQVIDYIDDYIDTVDSSDFSKEELLSIDNY